LYFVLGLAAVVALIVFFGVKEKYEIIVPIITGVLGLGSGIALGRSQR